MSVQGSLRCPDRVIKIMRIYMISMPHNKSFQRTAIAAAEFGRYAYKGSET